MTGPTPAPTRRFSDRVEDYERYRPRYPASVLDVLRERIGLEPTWVVADIGSGTGISTELLLGAGHEVFAVEPNDAMRAAAEDRLGGVPGFHSVAGTAEHTGLKPGSVDVVVAAQAFHWFDARRARREASRILRGRKWAVLIWNTRHADATPFLRAYEALLVRHGTDYEAVRHDWKDAGALEAFFTAGFERSAVPNEQLLDYEGLRGRLMSSSYVPAAGAPGHEAMLRDLRALFSGHERHGVVRMSYDCEIVLGRLVSVT